MSNKIDHIAIAVKDLKKSIEQWKRYFKIKECYIEEIEEKSNLSNFLKNKGEGIHHICFKVQDIDKTVIELKKQGIRFVSKETVMGASGSRIIFIHPDNLNGVLIELKG
jgi:methylmalonyl-CoA/ethylmalonyl-CoA epimerase